MKKLQSICKTIISDINNELTQNNERKSNHEMLANDLLLCLDRLQYTNRLRFEELDVLECNYIKY